MNPRTGMNEPACMLLLLLAAAAGAAAGAGCWCWLLVLVLLVLLLLLLRALLRRLCRRRPRHAMAPPRSPQSPHRRTQPRRLAGRGVPPRPFTSPPRVS